jgi:L-cystine transport system substrate-binding protein
MRFVSSYIKTIPLLLAVLLVVALAGCGSQPTQSGTPATGEPASGETDAGKQEVKKIGVGTMGTYYPFSYVDEKGRVTGFDIEVLREVEKRVEGIQFEFKPTPWDSMFLGLEAGKYQVVANQITKNPEREQKYLFTDNSYFTCQSVIIVKKGRKDIKSLDDLQGKTVGSAVGDSFTKILEDYNKEHNNAINIKYYDGTDPTTILQDVAAGRIDAYLNDPIMASETAKKLGLDVEIVEKPVEAVPAYFVFRKDEEGQALKEKVDKALAEMIQDGTLSKMSIEWFGKDYTKPVQ